MLLPVLDHRRYINCRSPVLANLDVGARLITCMFGEARKRFLGTEREIFESAINFGANVRFCKVFIPDLPRRGS